MTAVLEKKKDELIAKAQRAIILGNPDKGKSANKMFDDSDDYFDPSNSYTEEKHVKVENVGYTG